MRKPKNPMGPYPPGRTSHPKKSARREALEAEFIREARRNAR